VIPLFQFTPPFVLILSFLFLGEILTKTYYFAFVLILVGGFLISLQKAEGIFKLRNAFWWMVLSSLIYAIQAVILKSLYATYPFWDLTVYLGFGEFLPTPILLLLITNFRNRPVSLISVFRGFQSVFVLIYAILFSIWLPKILKEELNKRILGIKAIAIFLMVISLYLIYK